MAIGRISGPLLKDNLLRDGVDLAFETDLLYLDVINGRVGVKTRTPTNELSVIGTTRSTNVEVTTQLTVGSITINSNTITGTDGILNLTVPDGDQVIYQAKLKVDNVTIDNNVISTNTANTNLEIRPDGTGTVEVYSNATIYGNLHATGNITADGTVTIGDVNTDNVVINADIASDIIPDQNVHFNLGSTDKRWNEVWTENAYLTNIATTGLVVDGVDLNLRQGKILYVATNGSDSASGTHQNDPVASVKHALSIASTGDTVFVYPGTYLEIFPLTVPVGVTVRGTGLRSVLIKPTVATRYNDAFLLNGETTIEDLSIGDFFSGGNFYTVVSASAGSVTFNVGPSPFAHVYVSGGNITVNGSSYIVTNATYNNTTGNVTITHAGGTAAGTVFVSGLTFSCNGGTRVFPDNGYAFRFATDFAVSTKSPYVRNVTVITRGSVTSPSDPYGFDAGDAGKGAYVDGAYATAASNEAAMLFHSVTFITPNVDTLTATNGARVEWLNSFTYFANKGINLYSSNDGLAGQGKTQLRLSNTTGTFNVGDTVTYYSTYPTALASGTVAKKDADGKIYLTGKRDGFATKFERGGKTIQAFGSTALSQVQKKFGTASLLLSGPSDYAFVQNSTDFAFGTADFTIEFWIYRSNVSAVEGFLDFRTANPQNAAFLYANGSSLHYYVNGSNVITAAAATTSNNTWYHVAISRHTGSTRMFVNGTQVGSTWVDATSYIASPIVIGNNYTHDAGLSGYIDDLRVSNGIGRYTTTFAAPVSILGNDSHTVLLSHFDGATGSTLFVDETFLVQDIRSSSGGTAQFIELADYSDFGAEIRSIGSACVYGNYGVYGNGHGVVAYLIGQNLAYIGVGKRSDNDVTYVVQDNEVTETNGAKIYYSSVDHKGDFRVGDLFYVNQQDGTVQFSTASFNVTTTDGITITTGGNTTYIDGTEIDTGNLRLSGNTFSSTTGDINVIAASDQINFTNNVNIAGNLAVTGNVTIAGNIQVGDQTSDTVNFVAGVSSDIIPQTTGTYNLGSPSLQWKWVYADQETIGQVHINNNVITTSATNTDLSLQADGTGKVIVPSNDVELTHNLTVNGTTYLKDTGITGTVTQTGSVTQTGDYTQTGNTGITGTLTVTSYGQFEKIRIDSNIVSTTATNTDLDLQANGTGRIYVPNNNVQFDQNLTVNGTTSIATLTSSGTITANKFTTGDAYLQSNFIDTSITNHNLELRANGTGKILVPSNNVEITNNLTVTTGTTALKNTTVVGTLTQTGNVTQTGDYTQTGNTGITGNLTVSSYAQFEKIRIDSNVLSTTATNTDLSLQANGTGKVLVPNNNVLLSHDLTVNGTTNLNSLTVANTIPANAFTTGDIYIDDNYITTTLANSNLELRANGTGKILVPSNNFEVTNNLTVTTGTTALKTTGITGTLTHVGNVTRTGDVNQTGNYTLSGTIQVGSTAQFKDIKIDNNIITTTLLNNDLELVANGTGRIYIPTNDVRFDQALSVGGLTSTANINSSGTVQAVTFTDGNIQITGNTIQTTTVNSNLLLSAAGTGLVRFEQIDVQDNEIKTNTNTDIILAPNGTGIVNINSTQSVKLPVGSTTDRPSPGVAGMMRFNSTLSRFEGFDGTNWIRLDGLYDLDENTYVTAELTPGANDNTFRFVSDGVLIADLNATRFRAAQLDVDSININNNVISTTTTDTDLVVQTSGTGSVKLGNFAIRSNIITNTVSNSITNIIQNGTGYFKIAGTSGFVIPSGTSEQRPGLLEIGMMRFNTTDGRVEVWDGLVWQGAAGASVGVTSAEAADISILSVLMLG